MRVIIQRVSRASVEVNFKKLSGIENGILVFLGIKDDDNEKDIEYLINKCINLRLFENGEKNFDLSIHDVGGEILVVSQFTLYADCRKGRRPDFTAAAKPGKAEKLYQEFVEKLGKQGLRVRQGEFGEHMKVDLCNDGPVTIILDSKSGLI